MSGEGGGSNQDAIHMSQMKHHIKIPQNAHIWLTHII